MKVKCIDDDCYDLTIGKIYEATNENGSFYRVIGDAGTRGTYFKTRFEIVEDKPQPDHHVILNVLRGGGSHLSKKEKQDIYKKAANLIEKLIWEK
jgi:hypothetical protein